MRPSAVAYVLFLCDRPKPHARHANAGTSRYITYTKKLVLLTTGPGAHMLRRVESNVMPGRNGEKNRAALSAVAGAHANSLEKEAADSTTLVLLTWGSSHGCCYRQEGHK